MELHGRPLGGAGQERGAARRAAGCPCAGNQGASGHVAGKACMPSAYMQAALGSRSAIKFDGLLWQRTYQASLIACHRRSEHADVS